MELPLAGVDVVEVAPPYDHAEITAFLANRVVLEALSGIAWQRRNAAGPAAGPGGAAGAGTGAGTGPGAVRWPEAPLLEGRGPAKEG